jgi:hypothetical protein
MECCAKDILDIITSVENEYIFLEKEMKKNPKNINAINRLKELYGLYKIIKKYFNIKKDLECEIRRLELQKKNLKFVK